MDNFKNPAVIAPLVLTGATTYYLYNKISAIEAELEQAKEHLGLAATETDKAGKDVVSLRNYIESAVQEITKLRTEIMQHHNNTQMSINAIIRALKQNDIEIDFQGVGTYGSGFQPNVHGGNFQPNVHGGNFQPNVHGGNFQPNVNQQFTPNTGFQPNVPGGNFQPNVNQQFTPNTGFQPNVPGGNFQPNVNQQFTPNVPGGNFQPNNQSNIQNLYGL